MKKHLLLAALLLVAGTVYAQSTAAILEEGNDGDNIVWGT